MTVKVAIIADDLTGAVDSAAPFAARGLSTLVALQPDALALLLQSDANVIAVSTNSRECSSVEAGHLVAQAAHSLASLRPAIVFKKIDSRLKGHLDTEISACATAFDRPHWIVAPALPEFGRIVSKGMLSGFGIAQPIMVQARLGSGEALIPDVEQPQDFAAIVDAIVASTRTLAIGARGLAEAVAQRLAPGVPPALPPLQGPMLFAIGSVDPITRNQLAQLSAATGSAVLGPDDRIDHWNGQDLAILATPDLLGAISIEPAQQFTASVRHAIMALRPGTLLVTGGETAAMVLAALGINHLQVEGELVPGIGQAVVTMDYGPLRILTKSGGFGTDDTLRRLYDMVGTR